MSKFLSTLTNIGHGISTFVLPISQGFKSLDQGNIGKGLLEIFVPGVAQVNTVKEIVNNQSTDELIWDNVKDTDFNGDGITLETDVEIVKGVAKDIIDKKTGVFTAYDEIQENIAIAKGALDSEESLNESNRNSKSHLGLIIGGILASAFLFL